MITLTPRIWDRINTVNCVWNDKILYESDSDHYGKKEFWCFPEDLRGDCEDFAIAKRQALLSHDIHGFFATCWTQKVNRVWAGYHGVLVIDTDRGAFILSSGIDDVPSYDDLPWKWHKRECEDRQWRKILS